MYMRTDLQMCGKLNVQSKKRCMVSGSLFSKSFFDTSNLVRILRLLKGDEGHKGSWEGLCGSKKTPRELRRPLKKLGRHSREREPDKDLGGPGRDLGWERG